MSQQASTSEESLARSLAATPIVVIDVETTGASMGGGDRMIELAIVRLEGGRIVDRFEQLLDPERHLPAHITRLTGITPDMLAGQPTFAEVLPRVLSLCDGCVVAGHNVLFDLGFVGGELRLAGVDPTRLIARSPVLDTLRIARKTFQKKGNALQLLADKLGIVRSAAHRAMADVETTIAVLDRLIEPLGGWEMAFDDLLRAQGGDVRYRRAALGHAAVYPALQRAVAARGPIEILYQPKPDALAASIHDAATPSPSIRRVHPLGLSQQSDGKRLIARPVDQTSPRNFSVERILAVRSKLV